MSRSKALPHSCAVYASAAVGYLEDAGYETELLQLSYRDAEGEPHCHLIALWFCRGIVRAYDSNDGTLNLPKGITLKCSPMKIARAWLKLSATRPGYRVTAACWF